MTHKNKIATSYYTACILVVQETQQQYLPEERFEQTKRTLLYQKRSLQFLRAGIN
jgi:hypothetical protein